MTTPVLTPRKLGATDLRLSPIGIGTWQFAGGRGFYHFYFRYIPPAEKAGIIRAARQGGINWFDTAEVYGFGRSERALRDALQTEQVAVQDVWIASKWWPLPRFAGSIRRTISSRLKSLAPYTLDLHQIHWPTSFASIEAQMDAMADLVEAGQIRAVGVSNFSADQMRQAHAALQQRGLVLASNQVHFNLLDRSIERNGVLDTARELGISIIAYSPIASGLLSGRFHRDPEALDSTPLIRRISLSAQVQRTRPLIDILAEIAGQRQVTITQVALNWVVTVHGEMVVAIPGASRIQHAEEAAGVLAFQLNADEIARLDGASQLVQ